MSLKLLFALHKTEAKLTEKELHAVIVFWRKRREVPCLNLIFPKLNRCYVLHFCELLVFTQTCSIQLFMTLYKYWKTSEYSMPHTSPQQRFTKIRQSLTSTWVSSIFRFWCRVIFKLVTYYHKHTSLFSAKIHKRKLKNLKEKWLPCLQLFHLKHTLLNQGLAVPA